MNTPLIREWVKELRSGKWQQCRNALKTKVSNNNYSYCCLGVICETKKLESKKGRFSDNYWFAMISEDGNRDTSSSTLPEPLRKLIGITDKEQEYLMFLNDDKKLDFSQIADYLEEKYLKDEDEN